MGETIQQLDNGIMVRDERGRFLPGTTAKHTITQADASTLARRRWDKAAAASRAALLQAVNEAGILPSPRNTPVEAWGTLVGHAAELALTTDNARGVADLTRMVGQATQYLPTAVDAKQADVHPGLTATVHVPLEQLAGLVEALRAERTRRGQTDADPHTPTTSGDDVGD